MARKFDIKRASELIREYQVSIEKRRTRRNEGRSVEMKKGACHTLLFIIIGSSPFFFLFPPLPNIIIK